VHLVAERGEHRHLRKPSGQRGRTVQQPVVPGLRVPLLVREYGIELPALEAAQRGGGHDELRRGTGQPPGVGPLALQHHQPAVRGFLAGQQRRPYKKFGPVQATAGTRPYDLPDQHRDAPQTGARKGHRGGRRPGPRTQRVGVHDGVRCRGEQMAPHRLPGRRRAERHRQRTAQQYGRHHALPHPQRDHRFTVRPVGPGEQPGGDDGGQRAEQQQCRGDHHGDHPMSDAPFATRPVSAK
jgi:hypothetical protein